jgi:diaminohydroxyphosphoribosylaminopyrimidine deaminase/5-amino-6-(5-phosphoribosylamino)uracil reductase
MDALGRREIDSILLEGGGTLNEAMLQAGLVQKVYTYMAPLLLGGKDAKTPVEGLGFPAPGDGIRLTSPAVTPIGDDLLIEFNVPSPHPESRA